MLKWLALALLVAGADQITKYYAAGALILHQPVEVFPGFNLTLAHNSGAAFSFLSQAGGWQRWFFAAVAAIIMVVIVGWLRALPAGRRWLPSALALVLGGAAGNLWDRLYLGYVIDFIQVYLPFLPWRLFNPWPTFNIADAAISIGAVMLLIDAIWFSEAAHKS